GRIGAKRWRRSCPPTPGAWSTMRARHRPTGSTSMISGRTMKHATSAFPLALLLALASTWPGPAGAEQRQPGRVAAGCSRARRARPAPSRTPFVELRHSRLLKTPLRLSGEYRRPAAGTLVREVQSPYRETTTLEAGAAVIEREGRAPRRVQLDRAPELAGLGGKTGR